MGSPFKQGPADSGVNLVSMHHVLIELDLDVKRIATAHGARIFTFKDMPAAAAKFSSVACVGESDVCY